tara:strand:- start:70 stop:1236 length:1167 start_codon:yes stop_codon:yes gene_type:complete
MNLLFIHDHPFFEDNHKVYSGGGLPNNTWPKYLKNFSTLTVFGRKSTDLKDKKVLSSKENVSFYLTENYTSLSIFIKNHQKLKRELLFLMDNADVVLIRLPSILGIVAANIAYNQNKKVWVEVVGNAKEALENHGSILGKFSAPILEILNKRLINKANYVSYVTQFKLQLDYPSNKKAITSCISNVIINNIIDSDDINRNRFTLPVLKICLIGGFDVKYKGQNLLLKAVSALPNHIKNNIELFFIGKGNYDWLEDIARELNLSTQIKFIGSMESGEPILKLLQQMSLYIQPSLTEGMPRALLEAMSMGCPVMGSKVGGIPDVVSDHLLHDKGDFKTIANQLASLFLNRQILSDESFRSLKVIEPYLKTNLDNKRDEFYAKMNENLKND